MLNKKERNLPAVVAVLYNSPPPGAGPEEQDTVVQAEYVTSLLQELGCAVWPLPVDDRPCGERPGPAYLERCVRDGVQASGAGAVVNLVEAVAGSARGASFVPMSLEQLAVPYTGSGATAMLCSSNKLLAKQILHAGGLSTPERVRRLNLRAQSRYNGSCIVKNVWEHASLGIDAGSVLCRPTGEELARALADRRQRFGGDWYAEAYVEGGEFNVSLLETPLGVRVLPVAEIVFENWDEDLPRIVDFAAKWSEGEAAFKNTKRRFRYGDGEGGALVRAERIALECWKLFGLSGYARVDMRLDASGRLWVIDVNANPCLSPDAGFMAAVQAAGLQPFLAMEYLLLAAQNRSSFPFPGCGSA